MDLELEQQVWQRVAGERPSLQGMELRCRESAAAFLQMTRGASGDTAQILEELCRQERGNAQALRGMRVLAGEEPEPLRSNAAPRDGLRRALAQAYRRSLRARTDYCTCAQRGDYAPVFADMEAREAATQGKLLQLLGTV